jgi:phosphatidylinositol alpha-mannosyltransferase
MVIAEAFACGTPVVASNIVGYREVANAETGILTPPGDRDALTAGLVELLEDDARRAALASRAREVAQERYGWERITGRLLEIYSGLTGLPTDSRLVSA